MANLDDYIGWRGDISFDYDPFNEVDNLVFSVLAYAELDGILMSTDLQTQVSLKDLSDAFFKAHPEEELLSRDVLTKNFPLLLRSAGSSVRFQDVRACAYENHVSTETDAQMSAVTFLLDDRTAYVAFRGTDNSVVGWKEDFELSYLSETTGQKLAVAYLNRLFADTDLTLYVGGHSKGGNFAVYASAFCREEVKRQIRQIYSNDGPGFREEITKSGAYREIAGRIVSIIPENSIIGTLLDTTQAQYIVKSSRKGIMQHDALSWQIYGRHFEVVTGRSGSSRFMENTIDNWVGSMDDAKRRSFVEDLFSFFEITGHDTFEEIKNHGFSSVKSIWQYTKELPAEDRSRFLDTLGQLVKSGKDTAWEKFKEQLLGKNTLDEEEKET